MRMRWFWTSLDRIGIGMVSGVLVIQAILQAWAGAWISAAASIGFALFFGGVYAWIRRMPISVPQYGVPAMSIRSSSVSLCRVELPGTDGILHHLSTGMREPLLDGDLLYILDPKFVYDEMRQQDTGE